MTYSRVWRDPVQVVIDALEAESITAYPTVPNPRPAEFVTVQRDGGSNDHDGIFDIAQMDVEVWSGEQGDSLADVWSLANQVREELRMMAASTSNGVARVEIDTIGYLPDEISDAPRVIITAGVWLRPVAAS